MQTLKLTREYVGGLIAGFGFGVMLISALFHLGRVSDPFYTFIVGMFVCPIGTWIAYHAQQRAKLARSNDVQNSSE